MSKFWMTTEDPMYDEDGVLIDEDTEWEDIEGLLGEEEDFYKKEAAYYNS